MLTVQELIQDYWESEPLRQSELIVTGIIIAAAIVAMAWYSIQQQEDISEIRARNLQIPPSDHALSPQSIPVRKEVSSAIGHGDVNSDDLELGPGEREPILAEKDSPLDTSGPGEGPDDVHTSGPGPGAGYDHDLQLDDGPGAADVDIDGPGPGDDSLDIGGPGPGDRGSVQ